MQSFFLSLMERNSISKKPSSNRHLLPCWDSQDCTGNKTGTGKSDSVTELMSQRETQKQRNHHTSLTGKKAKWVRSGQGQSLRFSNLAWLSLPKFWCLYRVPKKIHVYCKYSHLMCSFWVPENGGNAVCLKALVASSCYQPPSDLSAGFGMLRSAIHVQWLFLPAPCW